MKKIVVAAGIVVVFQANVFSQERIAEVETPLLPSLNMHYQPEYTYDRPSDLQAWQKQKSGIHVSFASTERSYFRTEVPMQTESVSWHDRGWKGDRLNTEILVWSPDSLEQVRFRLTDLVSEKGKVISKKNLKMNMIRYVLGNYPYGAPDAGCGGTPYKTGFLMPDRFESFERFDLPGRSVRPFWLSLDIPSGSEPGTYKGVIQVNSTKGNAVLQVEIQVQNQLLPPPAEWSYRLDLWQNPWAVAWYNHVQPWSEEHKALLRKHLQLYANAGGKYITTYAVHSPWGDNSYMIEGGMIDWIKQKDGNWKFDYTIFDTYVELAMSVGIDKAITIYSPLPYNTRFRVLDESTGNYAYEIWPVDSKVFRERWNIFLNDLRTHLEKKGWFKKTYIGINESEMKQTIAAINVVKGNSKDWKITYAGNWHPELDTLLDDYCFLYGNEPDALQLKIRAARGCTSTYYVCCNPAKPNNFVFSPPEEGRWISWYSAAAGYNGFLRWAYDAWPQDPMRDARFGSWPSGDCFMVYPGANSSIRFEKLREGIVDFEKISILKGLVAKSKDKTVQQLWQDFEQHLKVFTAEHEFKEEKIISEVNRGREILDELTDRLTPGKIL